MPQASILLICNLALYNLISVSYKVSFALLFTTYCSDVIWGNRKGDLRLVLYWLYHFQKTELIPWSRQSKLYVTLRSQPNPNVLFKKVKSVCISKIAYFVSNRIWWIFLQMTFIDVKNFIPLIWKPNAFRFPRSSVLNLLFVNQRLFENENSILLR
jgi:hypothetical protein